MTELKETKKAGNDILLFVLLLQSNLSGCRSDFSSTPEKYLFREGGSTSGQDCPPFMKPESGLTTKFDYMSTDQSSVGKGVVTFCEGGQQPDDLAINMEDNSGNPAHLLLYGTLYRSIAMIVCLSISLRADQDLDGVAMYRVLDGWGHQSTDVSDLRKCGDQDKLQPQGAGNWDIQVRIPRPTLSQFQSLEFRRSMNFMWYVNVDWRILML